MLTAILAIALTSSNVPIASWLKPLKPNQPNQSKKVPSVTNGILEAAKGTIDFFSPFLPNLPSLAPKTITPANAAEPPHACTNVDPAKSEKPAALNQPPPHCQPIETG